MCMFQENTIYNVTPRERVGYKMVKVTRKGNIVAPIQTGVRYKVGKWNVAGVGIFRGAYSYSSNPGFNVYTKKSAVLSHLKRRIRWDKDADRFTVVRVTGRKVVSTGRNGFCAMELFIGKSAAYQAKRFIGSKRQKTLRAEAKY